MLYKYYVDHFSGRICCTRGGWPSAWGWEAAQEIDLIEFHRLYARGYRAMLPRDGN